MKLYVHPGASSLSVHILLREIGEPFELEAINVTAKRRAEGADYREIAPRGMVPLLELSTGERLTENLVIAQYVCDAAGRTDLMPAAGTLARYRVMEWQSFVAAELHKSFIPLNWKIDAPMRELVLGRIRGRLPSWSRVLPDRFSPERPSPRRMPTSSSSPAGRASTALTSAPCRALPPFFDMSAKDPPCAPR